MTVWDRENERCRAINAAGKHASKWYTAEQAIAFKSGAVRVWRDLPEAKPIDRRQNAVDVFHFWAKCLDEIEGPEELL